MPTTPVYPSSADSTTDSITVVPAKVVPTDSAITVLATVVPVHRDGPLNIEDVVIARPQTGLRARVANLVRTASIKEPPQSVRENRGQQHLISGDRKKCTCPTFKCKLPCGCTVMLFLLAPLLAVPAFILPNTYSTGELPLWYELEVCRDAAAEALLPPTSASVAVYTLTPPRESGSACPLVPTSLSTPLDISVLPTDGIDALVSTKYRPVVYIPGFDYSLLSFTLLDANGAVLIPASTLELGPDSRSPWQQLLGQPPSPPMPRFTVEEGKCAISADGDCVHSPNFPANYGVKERCMLQISPYIEATISFTHFRLAANRQANSYSYSGTEAPGASLTLTGVRAGYSSSTSYTGYSGPTVGNGAPINNLIFAPRAISWWSGNAPLQASSSDPTPYGWEICLTNIRQLTAAEIVAINTPPPLIPPPPPSPPPAAPPPAPPNTCCSAIIASTMTGMVAPDGPSNCVGTFVHSPYTAFGKPTYTDGNGTYVYFFNGQWLCRRYNNSTALPAWNSMTWVAGGDGCTCPHCSSSWSITVNGQWDTTYGYAIRCAPSPPPAPPTPPPAPPASPAEQASGESSSGYGASRRLLALLPPGQHNGPLGRRLLKGGTGGASFSTAGRGSTSGAGRWGIASVQRSSTRPMSSSRSAYRSGYYGYYGYYGPYRSYYYGVNAIRATPSFPTTTQVVPSSQLTRRSCALDSTGLVGCTSYLEYVVGVRLVVSLTRYEINTTFTRPPVATVAIAAAEETREVAPLCCTNTCYNADDNDCDDGGLGAEYRSCALGTDCTDCGPRFSCSSSPPPPPPPRPPTPGEQLPPDTTCCTNTCNYADDNECDDGGLGAEYSACTLGTDCADCGPRAAPCTSVSSPPPPLASSYASYGVQDGCLCGNTCNSAGDGDCDDGGSGSEYSVCTLGTDCADCGRRECHLPPLPPSYPDPLPPPPAMSPPFVPTDASIQGSAWPLTVRVHNMSLYRFVSPGTMPVREASIWITLYGEDVSWSNFAPGFYFLLAAYIANAWWFPFMALLCVQFVLNAYLPARVPPTSCWRAFFSIDEALSYHPLIGVVLAVLLLVQLVGLFPITNSIFWAVVRPLL